MRLICLNTWGGKLYDGLSSFLERSRKTTDLFCFQEVFTNPPSRSFKTGDPERIPDLYERLGEQLPGFTRSLTKPYTSYGERLALFARGTIKIEDQGEMALLRQRQVVVDKKKISVGSRMQWIRFHHNNKWSTVVNIHGVWLPNGKKDSPERFIQTKNIVGFLQHREGAKILCGDFNLLPQTRCIDMLERNLRSLVREYGVMSTRSSHYPAEKEKFADYVFTSSEVRVLDFRVLEDEVSDHLPLLLEFDLV